MTDVRDRRKRALADRYRIERELGQGGIVPVHLADDREQDREVTLEVVQPASGRKAPPGRGAMPSRLERRER